MSPRQISENDARGKAIASYDPRKQAIVAALKAASGCRKVTTVRELKGGGYSGHCLNGPDASVGYWWVPSTAVATELGAR